MQRLRDSSPASGSPEAELVEAIRTMEPVVATAARQQRILAAVISQPRPRRWRGIVLLRPVVAASILLLAGAATAMATVGHGWVARSWHRLTTRPVAVAPQPVPAVPRGRPARAAESAPAVEPAAPEAIAPAQPAPRAPVVHIAARVRPAARGEDPSALVDAVRALRNDHDPQRAARLLDAYQRTYPRGALAEEALALQIEAAAALKSPRAEAFAQQYLRTYPSGRFRQTAGQVLAATAR